MTDPGPDANATGVVSPTLPPIVVTAESVALAKIPSASVVVTFVSPSDTASPATTSLLSKLVTNKVLLEPVVDESPEKLTSPSLISYPSFCTIIMDELSDDRVAVTPVVVV